MQLDLFDNRSVGESEILLQVYELKNSQDKLRRGIFQRYDELKKTVVDLQMKLAEIEKKEKVLIWSA